MQRFSWLGTNCHRYHRKREDTIFTHAKLVQFYYIWKVWPSKCQLGPAKPSLPVSQISQYLACNAAGAVVNCEAEAVQMELLGEAYAVKELQTEFTERHALKQACMHTRLSRGICRSTHTHVSHLCLLAFTAHSVMSTARGYYHSLPAQDACA